MNKNILGIMALIVGLGGLLAIGAFIAKSDDGQVADKENKTTTKVESYKKVKTDEKNIKEDIKEEDIESEDQKVYEEAVVGELAPDFKLKNLDGKEVSLSDYKGKKVLINFWATWCKFCVTEMPDLNQIDKENEDVVVLAVDVMEEPDKVKSYIDKGGYDFEVVLDTKGDIARSYLVSAFPTTYAIDEEGVIVTAVPGMLTKPQMKQVIDMIGKK